MEFMQQGIWILVPVVIMVVDFADLSNKHCCILGEEWILEIVD